MDTPIQVDLGRIAQDLQIRRLQVESVVQLLDEGNTVPFITRYRKERTGNLEETAIREIQRRVIRLRELAERKQTVLRSIEAQGRLTEELAEAIRRADTPQRLEDLYLPFKPKKKTKASEARDKGLEPLALRIWNRDESLLDLRGAAEAFVDPSKGLDSVDQVIEGVGHILAESISELATVRDAVRRVVWRLGRLVTRKADNLPEGQGLKYADYFDYSEPVGQVPPHRVLAINRGDKEGPLKVKIEVPREDLEQTIRAQLPLEGHPQSEAFTAAAFDALDRLLMPALEREVRRELTERAEQHAVEVFARNLRSLLLQPPIPKQTVLAIDPGFRTGCKVAVLDPIGNVKEHGVVFLMPAHRRAEGKRYLKDLVARHDVQVIAIGNGTASRETEEMIVEIIEEGTRFHEMALRGEEFTPPPPEVQDLPPLQAPETFGSGLTGSEAAAEAAAESASAEASTPSSGSEPSTTASETTPQAEPISASDAPAATEATPQTEPIAASDAPAEERPASAAAEVGTDTPRAETGETIENQDQESPTIPEPTSSNDQNDGNGNQGEDGRTSESRPGGHAEALPPISGGAPAPEEEPIRPIRGGAPNENEPRPSPTPQDSPPAEPQTDLVSEAEPGTSPGQSEASTPEPQAEPAQQDHIAPPDGPDASSSVGGTSTEVTASVADTPGAPAESAPATQETASTSPAQAQADTSSAEPPPSSPAPAVEPPSGGAAAATEAGAEQPLETVTEVAQAAPPSGEVTGGQVTGGEVKAAPTSPEASEAAASASASPGAEGEAAPSPSGDSSAAPTVVDLTKPPVGMTTKPKGQQGSGKKQRDRDQRPKPKGPPPPPMPHPADPLLAKLSYVIVNEAGASVYSASPIGKEEFPNYDATTRGTISIGRRLQDPLAELVKIEPQNIGVGLYQHDVGVKQLKESLESVIESCVNYVGVDLNTASAPLLRHVSGLNSLTARRLVEYRQQHGPFTRRDQIRQVEGIGDATFTQAAGFLKILEGENPLDRTWVHPESYPAAEKLLAWLGFDVETLQDKDRLDAFRAKLGELKDEEITTLAQELDLGELTLRDILDALAKPGRDPREDLPKPVFKKGFLKLEDLQPGMELRGTVLNVVDFGAFVDIGLKDSGLVHISQLANRYVKSPHDVVSVGDVVTVWVLSVDQNRKKVSLTMVPPGTERPRGRGHGDDGAGEGQGRPPRGRGRGRGQGRSQEGQPRRAEGDAPASGESGPPERRPGTGRIPGPPMRAQQAQRGRGGRGGGGGRGFGRGGPGGGRSEPVSSPPRPTTPRKPPPPPEPLSQDAIKGSVPLRSFGQLAQLWKKRTDGDETQASTDSGEPPRSQEQAPPPASTPPSESSPPPTGSSEAPEDAKPAE